MGRCVSGVFFPSSVSFLLSEMQEGGGHTTKIAALGRSCRDVSIDTSPPSVVEQIGVAITPRGAVCYLSSCAGMGGVQKAM